MSDVLTVAEHRNGEIRDVSYELISASRELADSTDGDVHVAVVSGDVESLADTARCDAVDTIHTIAYGEEFNHDVYVQAITQLATYLEPQFLVAPNSVNGMDYVPAVAEALGRPLVTDAIDIEHGDSVDIVREQYGGKVEVTVGVENEPMAITIRPSEWPLATQTDDSSVTVSPFSVEIDEGRIRSTVAGFDEVGGGDVDISDADFLISIGRGIQDEEHLQLIEALVDCTDATLAASRPIVDNGWLPKNRQVGQSGKVVTPDVYIAIGISGAVQHVAGMKGADTIVAINTDPNAPIFDIADYGIEDDLFDVVPVLIEEFGGDVP